MIKSIKAILAQDKEKFKVPRKVQDLIPIKNIWPDGIFKVGNKFSKSFRFSDINYLVASREDKESMFLTYSELLNSLDSGATTKITINNHRLNRSDFEESILMPMKQDGLDEYRKEYNDMLLDKATGANGITQEKYITITVAKKDIEEARAYFARIGADLAAHFANLGSKCVPLNAVERLRILHDFYRPGDEAAFSFDMNRKARLGHDFRDYICPDSIERAADHIKLGEKYARVLFLKDYASYIKDSMFSELTELNRNLMLSIDVIPIPTDEAVREVERLLLGVETNITGWQRRQNQNNNFSAVVPYDMELQRKESKEFLDDLTTRDQRMMFAVVTMVITADTKEQLDLDTETVLSTARKHMCQMATLKYQQTDGLNTVLPIGTRKINAFRTLTTESLAVLMPFKVQEIMDKGGIYFGENAISHNLIMCNKANLLNQSAFLLGVPGSGKSFSAKELITFLILNTNDDIMICDPEGEYAPLIEAMGDLGSVIRVSAGGRDRLNAMYMVDGYGENNPIVVKSEFIMSLIEQIDKKGVGPQHKSIIDRCITNVYRNAADTGTIPTLCTLRDMLLEQPEPEAKQIALSLELYTTGSLDIFGKQSNVDLDKRVVVFDIHGLGSQLKPTGLLVITDTMLNRVTLNWKKGNEDQKQQLAELLAQDSSMWAAVLYGIYGVDEQIVAVALSQVGNVGGEPYWSWYGFGSRVEWCACFVSWCANECGYIDTGVIPKFAGCVNGVQWFRERGQWADNAMQPSPGMIIFFDWDNKGSSGPQDGQADHVGIVQKVENGIVYTIEGNSSDSCRVNQYPVGYYEILGYGVVAY